MPIICPRNSISKKIWKHIPSYLLVYTFITVKKIGNNPTIHQLVLISKQWNNNEWCTEWLPTCMTTCNNMDKSQKHNTNKPNKKQYIKYDSTDIWHSGKGKTFGAGSRSVAASGCTFRIKSSGCHNSVYICQTWTLHFKLMNYFVCKFNLNKATGKIITGNWERVKDKIQHFWVYLRQRIGWLQILSDKLQAHNSNRVKMINYFNHMWTLHCWRVQVDFTWLGMQNIYS